jgi:hypothetical protein
MLFFFDESGDFGLPTADEHKCAVICGIVIPETIAENIRQDFVEFVSGLSSAEKSNGEPKGSLLTEKKRKLFCLILSRYKEILITPAILDLSVSLGDKTANIDSVMKAVLFENAKKCVYNTMRCEIEELGRQWGNLSINEGLKLVALASCFLRAIEFSVICHSDEAYHYCWENICFTIDAVRTAELTRDKKIFTWMVLMWLTAWSQRHPLTLIKEIHTADHPFVKTYDTKDGFDLGKMLKGNIKYEDSKTSYGLQIADICANIIYQAFHDLKNYNNKLSIFKMLMKNCPYKPKLGVMGLICVGEPAKKIPMPNKYRLLCQVMHSDK